MCLLSKLRWCMETDKLLWFVKYHHQKKQFYFRHLSVELSLWKNSNKKNISCLHQINVNTGIMQEIFGHFYNHPIGYYEADFLVNLT